MDGSDWKLAHIIWLVSHRDRLYSPCSLHAHPPVLPQAPTCKPPLFLQYWLDRRQTWPTGLWDLWECKSTVRLHPLTPLSPTPPHVLTCDPPHCCYSISWIVAKIWHVSYSSAVLVQQLDLTSFKSTMPSNAPLIFCTQWDGL